MQYYWINKIHSIDYRLANRNQAHKGYISVLLNMNICIGQDFNLGPALQSRPLRKLNYRCTTSKLLHQSLPKPFTDGTQRKARVEYISIVKERSNRVSHVLVTHLFA